MPAGLRQQGQAHEQQHGGDHFDRELGQGQVGSGQAHEGERRDQPHHPHQHHGLEALAVRERNRHAGGQQQQPDRDGQRRRRHQLALARADVAAGQGDGGQHERGPQQPGHITLQRTVFQPDRDTSRQREQAVDQAVEHLAPGGRTEPVFGADAVQPLAAREPEIVDLCNLLVAMGAQIEGIGTSDLIIHGKDRLHGATYRVMSDRIEAGSYACAAAITGGDIELVGAKASEMDATLHALRQAGVTVEETAGGIRVASDGKLKPLTISTAPYPGFATDMQAQFMAMLCMADGASVLTETIFENRYMHVPELNRMGAHIETKGRTAIVHGVKKMTGAPVMATDLRASMSLVIAGLVAEGETHVSRLYHLDRGYERLEEKLQLVGADVERVGSD